MPNNQKAFPIRTRFIEQYHEFNFEIWSNQVGDTKFAAASSSKAKLQEQGFSQGVLSSSFDELNTALLDCIEKNDENRLADLLSRDFIYEKVSEHTDNTYNENTSVETTYETYYVCPVLEAYFKNNMEDLMIIIDAIIKKNDNNLMYKFMNAIDEAEYFMKRLGQWNEEIIKTTLSQIEKLLQHGKKLVSKGDGKSITKGKDIIELTNNLAHIVSERSTKQPAGIKELFENILFKFELIKLLHSKDESLALHRNYNGDDVNEVSPASDLNKAKASYFLFKSKTASQEKVEKIERALYPRPK